MADHWSVGRAGEPAVGDQGNIVAQSLSHDGGGDRQHLLHAGPALGSFVADDDDVPRLDIAPLDGLESGRFLVEDPSRALEYFLLMSGNLDHRAVWGDVAPEDGQPAGGGAGRVDLVDHGLVFDGLDGLNVLPQSLSGNGHSVAVEQAGVQEPFHDQGDAAVTIEVGHDVFPSRLHIGDVRGVAADAVEVVQGQLNIDLPGDGDQVQHRIGRSAHGHGHGDSVLEGLFGQDVTGAHIFFQKTHQGPSHFSGLAQFLGVDGRDGGVAGKRHAQNFDAGGHGVCGEQAGAGTLSGTGHAFQRGEVFQAHVALGVGAHSLEHVLDIHVFALELTGHYGPAVHEDGRHVQTGHGHHAAGHVLVAAGDGDQAVHALAEGNKLDGVGDDFPADQRGLHTLGAHGDAVAHRDGAEFEWYPIFSAHAFFGRLGEPV
uniref:Uncharacterized protein n=1 Tax=uncultured marine microorganism HF4000_APKG5H11 TaxID=455550 RepID=B3T8I6_9ZZZZ|nr:hypothetical protein ALOHA_HF4000APKG5H11ctg2g13 [uncultured marine microorganism HF4000_APKG5H11]